MKIKNYKFTFGYDDDVNYIFDKKYKRILEEESFININNYYDKILESLQINTTSLKTQTKNLIEAFKNEDLVVVLGAGISMPFKIPDWNSLLERLLIEKNSSSDNDISSIASAFYSSLFESNPLILARYIQEEYKSGKGNLKFEKTVQKLLYENIDREVESKIMNEIVHLCVSPGKQPNLDSIITYNYDDVIEESIEKLSLDVPFKSIFHTGMKEKNGELPIYHVHGYLPENKNITEKHLITLSESIYHQQYLDTYSWSNIVQINKFSDKTCLIIGNSFTDPNLRRIMDIAKKHRGNSGKKHYIVKKRKSFNKVKMKLESLLDDDNLNQNKEKIKDIEFEELVNNLIKMNANLEEKDANSFGAEIIWINDYDQDISKLLNTIKNNKKLSNFD